MRRRALLDTHVWVWLVLRGPRVLSEEAARWATDPEADLFLSIASLWEAAVKAGLGKLDLGMGSVDRFAEYVASTRVTLLPVEVHHVSAVARMPGRGDPFDRMIAAQSRLEGLPLITADRAMFGLDPLGVIWAGRGPRPA
jgi:PIN domain nuclease of toxin-antitoxin system